MTFISSYDIAAEPNNIDKKTVINKPIAQGWIQNEARYLCNSWINNETFNRPN